jgi:hypothetical protein
MARSDPATISTSVTAPFGEDHVPGVKYAAVFGADRGRGRSGQLLEAGNRGNRRQVDAPPP